MYSYLISATINSNICKFHLHTFFCPLCMRVCLTVRYYQCVSICTTFIRILISLRYSYEELNAYIITREFELCILVLPFNSQVDVIIYYSTQEVQDAAVLDSYSSLSCPFSLFVSRFIRFLTFNFMLTDYQELGIFLPYLYVLVWPKSNTQDRKRLSESFLSLGYNIQETRKCCLPSSSDACWLV